MFKIESERSEILIILHLLIRLISKIEIIIFMLILSILFIVKNFKPNQLLLSVRTDYKILYL